MTKSKLVLFDWNGTFVNDETETVEGFREVLKGVGDERWKLGFDELVELHRKTFEIPLQKMYETLGLNFDQAEMAKENLFWKQKYFSLETQIKLQPGIKKSIDLLESKSCNFGILSNHVVEAINTALIRYGYKDILVLANNHDREAHVEGKLHRLEKYMITNPDIDVVALVGDSPEEIEIAKSLDIKSVAITNGWIPTERLSSSNPDYLLHSSELPDLFDNLLDK